MYTSDGTQPLGAVGNRPAAPISDEAGASADVPRAQGFYWTFFVIYLLLLALFGRVAQLIRDSTRDSTVARKARSHTPRGAMSTHARFTFHFFL